MKIPLTIRCRNPWRQRGRSWRTSRSRRRRARPRSPSWPSGSRIRLVKFGKSKVYHSCGGHDELDYLSTFQTLEVLRLQTELEEYEYEDANEWRWRERVIFPVDIWNVLTQVISDSMGRINTSIMWYEEKGTECVWWPARWWGFIIMLALYTLHGTWKAAGWESRCGTRI